MRRWLAAGTGLAAAVALGQLAPSVASLGQWVPVRRAGRCVWRGRGDVVALTFDDGPSPADTPPLLDRLDALDLPATFFCNGEAAARHPDLVGEIVARGHQVETHGFTHRHHLWSSPGRITADLDAAMAGLADLGVAVRWFRPPYGQISAGTVRAARRADVGLALWSAWGREWAAGDAGAVARRVIGAVGPGAVVLLHDSDGSSPAGSAARAREAVGPIADELERRGLRAVRLREMELG